MENLSLTCPIYMLAPPPLVRERHEKNQRRDKDNRITPARAGKTHGDRPFRFDGLGSPPLVRERPENRTAAKQ